jgi:hypothetical protein
MSDKIAPMDGSGFYRKPCLKCGKFRGLEDPHDPHDTRCFRCCGCSPDKPCNSAIGWDFKAYYIWKANACKLVGAKPKKKE